MKRDTLEKHELNKVYVGNLDPQTTEDQLRALFSTVGEIRNIKLGQKPGLAFAFITAGTDEAAATAITLFNNYTLNGKEIIVEPTRPVNLAKRDIATLRYQLGEGQPITV